MLLAREVKRYIWAEHLDKKVRWGGAQLKIEHSLDKVDQIAPFEGKQTNVSAGVEQQFFLGGGEISLVILNVWRVAVDWRGKKRPIIRREKR